MEAKYLRIAALAVFLALPQGAGAQDKKPAEKYVSLCQIEHTAKDCWMCIEFRENNILPGPYRGPKCKKVDDYKMCLRLSAYAEKRRQEMEKYVTLPRDLPPKDDCFGPPLDLLEGIELDPPDAD